MTPQPAEHRAGRTHPPVPAPTPPAAARRAAWLAHPLWAVSMRDQPMNPRIDEAAP